MYSGGTSMAGGNRRLLWIGGASAVLTMILLVVIMLIRGGGDDRQATPGANAAAETAPADAATDLAGHQPAQPAPTEPAGRSGQADEAARSLALALKNQRLWSTVVLDPADSKVLIIRSSLCDDDDVQAVVSTAQGKLSAKGVTAVRCVAAHGGLIFEKTF